MGSAKGFANPPIARLLSMCISSQKKGLRAQLKKRSPNFGLGRLPDDVVQRL
jgi:hypothetical protein